MKKVLFSCVVPVKGSRPFINEAMASLCNQGLDDELEIIVQDADIEPDNGLSDALNRGFAKAKGEWLFWLNADDVLLPGALRRVKGAIVAHPTEDWFAGNSVYMDEKGLAKHCRWQSRFPGVMSMFVPAFTGGPSSFFKKKLFLQFGGFDVSLKFVMDTDMTSRWIAQGRRFFVIKDFLWGFRVHDGSATLGPRSRQRFFEERTYWLKKHGFRNQPLWMFVSRVVQVASGDWLFRNRMTSRLRGVHVPSWRQSQKVLHIIPGIEDPTCGIAVAAKKIALRQEASGLSVVCVDSRADWSSLVLSADEVWVHSMWTPDVIKASLLAIAKRKVLVRMPHGCMDPVKLHYHWFRKFLVSFLERRLHAMASYVVSTAEDESCWIRNFQRGDCRSIEVVNLSQERAVIPEIHVVGAVRKLLYVGRLHPLKGVDNLIMAMPQTCSLVVIGKDEGEGARLRRLAAERHLAVTFLGVVSEEVKQREIDRCELLVLPTLSENFGLVIAEARGRGKPVLTTDGAPVWRNRSGVVYVDGYVSSAPKRRVELLGAALRRLSGEESFETCGEGRCDG